MTRLASRFGAANLIRRDRPLTREELFRVVPSVFSEDKHESRSERYTYIPTISLLDSLQREGFQPFFACQTRVRDPVVANTQTYAASAAGGADYR
jgi:hypothetical protein